MPSNALLTWSSGRSRLLDEIESAHQTIRGSGPGQRVAIQQINQAYAILLTAQFQAFCRDLHSECVDHLVRTIVPANFRTALREEFFLHRRLDQGNPNRGNIGADFNRLGMRFWPLVEAYDPRNAHRGALLGELNEWRNAIAHQSFTAPGLGGATTIRLQQVRTWRSACDSLVRSFDNVTRDYLAQVTGVSPWT